MKLWFFSFGKKMALFDFALTYEASTEFPRNNNTHFHSFPTS